MSLADELVICHWYYLTFIPFPVHKRFLFLVSLAFCLAGKAFAQHFVVARTGLFAPQHKQVLLLQDNASGKKMVFFKTNLYVNTDGTPISYHPLDLGGANKAINNIGNAIVVKRVGSNSNLCLNSHTYQEAMDVFKRYRDSGYVAVPAGYLITWDNVLIPETVNGHRKPCIIKTGKYQGYFASATSLKNGLTSNRGECECNNQVNPLEVPALVLAGGSTNPVAAYGAKVGDLVIAYNSSNGKLVYAIINDKGPANNLGEGSVLLNMKLANKTTFPTNQREANNLSINSNIPIAIIPGSLSFHSTRPYTNENIISRVDAWLSEAGFRSKDDLIRYLVAVK